MKAKTNFTMLCDFYQLTMSNGYFRAGLGERICYFDMFLSFFEDFLTCWHKNMFQVQPVLFLLQPWN